jgi:hypothetical protein
MELSRETVILCPTAEVITRTKGTKDGLPVYTEFFEHLNASFYLNSCNDLSTMLQFKVYNRFQPLSHQWVLDMNHYFYVTSLMSADIDI